MGPQETAASVDEGPAAERFEDVFAGPLAAWHGKLVRHRPAGSIAAAELGEGETFPALIARFQAARGGDRTAATSLWSQLYFSALIIPAVVAILGRDRHLRLGLGDMLITLCPQTGAPLRFGVAPQLGRAQDPTLFEVLVEGHLAPLIAMVRRQSGLSSRLLWENAGWYLVWILVEMSRLRPACLPLARGFLADSAWPAGHCHAIEAMKRAGLDGLPVTRRLCCLRYRVPGSGRCEGSCPLSQDAAAVGPPVSS